MSYLIGRGLKHFHIPTNFFEGNELRRLLAKYGANGAVLYLYITSEVLSRGYCMSYSKELVLDACFNLGLEPHEFERMWDFLIEREYFDTDIFEQYGLITSPYIQEQYQNCTAKMKRKVNVWRDLWLIPESETKPHVEFQEEEGKVSEIKQ